MPKNSFLTGMGKFALLGMAIGVIATITRRYTDQVKGKDPFSEHTRKQHKKRFISGMHQPFIADKHQQCLFQKHFSEFSHLLPISVEVFRKKQALRTPVKIKSLANCPVKLSFENTGTLAVGGPPALMSAVSHILAGNQVMFLNDSRRWPIAYGSAFHLEPDATSQATPTHYLPSRFFLDQFIRAIYLYESYESIEKNGYFSWKTFNWLGWIKCPEQWLVGIKLAFYLQLASISSQAQDKLLLSSLAQKCYADEKFYTELDKKLDNKLLLPGQGCIIVARTKKKLMSYLL